MVGSPTDLEEGVISKISFKEIFVKSPEIYKGQSGYEPGGYFDVKGEYTRWYWMKDSMPSQVKETLMI